MATDSERNYVGTNMAVVTLIVLLVAVASYFVIAQMKDVADDHVGLAQRAAAVR